MKKGLWPDGEDLRKAVQYISEHGDYSVEAIEAAARQFDLSPADEEFLLRHFLHADEGGD